MTAVPHAVDGLFCDTPPLTVAHGQVWDGLFCVDRRSAGVYVEPPRRLRFKSKVLKREIELLARERRVLQSSLSAQAEIDRARAVEQETQEIIRLLLERAAKQRGEIARIRQELERLELFRIEVSLLLTNLITIKKWREEEEILVLMLGSQFLQ